MGITEKLEEEKKKLLKKIPEEYKEGYAKQYDMVFDMMKEEAQKDPEFEKAVLNPEKSWTDCFKFMESEVRKSLPTGVNCAAVESTELLQMIRKYYLKKEVDTKQPKKTEEKKISEPTIVPEAKNVYKPATKRKAGKKEVENQMSLFDLFSAS